RLCDGRGPNAHAGVMSSKGLNRGGLAVYGERAALYPNAGGRFNRNRDSNGLARRNTTQYAARVIAGEAFGREFISMLRTALSNTVEAGPYRNSFHRVKPHHRMRDISIQPIVDRFSPTRGKIFSHDLYTRADGVTVPAQSVHIGFELGNCRSGGCE